MALVHCDPFAHYTSAQYTDIYTDGSFGASVAIGTHGPNGRPGLRFSGNLSYSIQRLGLTTSGAVCIMQGDLRISAAPASTNVILGPILGGSAALQCSVDINSDRTLSVHRGFGGTKTQLGSNSTYVLPLDTFVHIAAKFTIANSPNGSIVVHVWEDGDTAAQVVLSVTGVDTQDGATATWDGFDLGAGNASNTDWANFVVMDGSGSAANDFLGPADVWALWSNARETPALTDWSLSTGSDQAALVDDVTADDDTTYLEETTQNQQTTVAVDRIPYPTRAILGAQLYASVKLTSGSPSLRGIGYESATPNLGVTFAPTSAYTYLMGPYSAMPGGSAFSTAELFDALQWGLKLTTTTTGVRVTQIVVAVIQPRTNSKRNLATGYGHTIGGDDNLASGRENTVIGSNSQAHGTGATVVGDRSILINLDGVPRTLTGNGKFEVYGEIGGGFAGAIAGVGRLIGRQVITATGAGTYTPTSGTGSIVIELQGAGGGGGGIASPGASNFASGRGGGGGAYLRKRLTTAFSGASYSVGAKGTGGTAGNNAGNTGGDTTFTATGGGGTVYTAGGGVGGNGGTGVVPPFAGAVVAGGTATNGDINVSGGASFNSIGLSATSALGGRGGMSHFSAGAAPINTNTTNTSGAGNAATGYGGGGSAGLGVGTGAAVAGGDGSDGLLIIWEYS
jgi:hypothetical protein